MLWSITVSFFWAITLVALVIFALLIWGIILMPEKPLKTPFFVTCPECGSEQPDMGRGVQCEECGYGPMPYYDEEGRVHGNEGNE